MSTTIRVLPKCFPPATPIFSVVYGTCWWACPSGLPISCLFPCIGSWFLARALSLRIADSASLRSMVERLTPGWQTTFSVNTECSSALAHRPEVNPHPAHASGHLESDSACFAMTGVNVPVRGAQLGHTRKVKRLQPRNCRAWSRCSVRLQAYPIIMDSNAIHGPDTEFNS